MIFSKISKYRKYHDFFDTYRIFSILSIFSKVHLMRVVLVNKLLNDVKIVKYTVFNSLTAFQWTWTHVHVCYICRRPSVCRLSVVCLSVVCNVRAPYSSNWNFRQCFYAISYLGHLWPFGKNITEIVPGEPLRRGVKPKSVRKNVAILDLWGGYISETVQDRR